MHCAICSIFQDTIDDSGTGDGKMYLVDFIDLEGKRIKDGICEECGDNNITKNNNGINTEMKNKHIKCQKCGMLFKDYLICKEHYYCKKCCDKEGFFTKCEFGEEG